MFGSEIKTRVERAVKQKIDAGEKKYAEQCEQLERQLDADKLAAADEIVKSILGPLS